MFKKILYFKTDFWKKREEKVEKKVKNLTGKDDDESWENIAADLKQEVFPQQKSKLFHPTGHLPFGWNETGKSEGKPQSCLEEISKTEPEIQTRLAPKFFAQGSKKV